MRKFLTALSLATSLAGMAQTYFYIDHLAVLPANPTPQDNITIALSGGLSSSGAYVVSATASAVGNIVTIQVVAADPGGLAVIVPHTEQVLVGPLPAGTYTIVIDGTFASDFAPQPEHTFIVAGGTAATGCDSLDLFPLQWAPFDTGRIDVVVANPGGAFFNYPTFVLLDGQGDTLAVEVPNYFGIGTAPQVHALALHPGTSMPPGPFQASLHLWTYFFDTLACEWPLIVDLCPADPCVPVSVHLGNFGGAMVNGSIAWGLEDGGGNAVASGNLVLGALQADSATVCLPPGAYTLTMTHPTPLGGQLQYGVSAGAPGTSTLAEPFLSGGTVNTLPFTLFGACVNGSQSVRDAGADQGLVVVVEQGRLSVRASGPVGLLSLFDAQGRLCARVRPVGTASPVMLDPDAPGLYLVQAVDEVGAVRVARVLVR
ncbi:MAG: hypothetical protein IT228_07130 [Flavobacteriales bacterium]|nr:hypothetical protein [Flavobacteriales bacterium]MCC6577100.1 hypothetical protein [Flavobacteriales bacterium]NUQ15569.1 hypothetical protein [Flavobacteriales bacterium]